MCEIFLWWLGRFRILKTFDRAICTTASSRTLQKPASTPFATVVMNVSEYNDKINCLLSDSFLYSKLSKKSNPITKSHPMSINKTSVEYFQKSKNY